MVPAADGRKHVTYTQVPKSTRGRGSCLASQSVVFRVSLGVKLGKGPPMPRLAVGAVAQVHKSQKQRRFIKAVLTVLNLVFIRVTTRARSEVRLRIPSPVSLALAASAVQGLWKVGQTVSETLDRPGGKSEQV